MSFAFLAPLGGFLASLDVDCSLRSAISSLRSRLFVPLLLSRCARSSSLRSLARTHLPVSPLVAPTTVNLSLSLPRLPSFLLVKQYSNTFPKNCNATSLNANVGPCHNSNTHSLPPVLLNGVVSSCLNVPYDLSIISRRSSCGIDVSGINSDRMRKLSSAKERDFHDSRQLEGRTGTRSGM